MMASASPCSKVREISFKTFVSPKFLPMPEASSNAIFLKTSSAAEIIQFLFSPVEQQGERAYEHKEEQRRGE